MKRKIETNLHTHTTFCDGKNTVDEMVEKAIEKGFSILGFSGHGYFEKDTDFSMDLETEKKYRDAVLKAKEKYKEKIHIFLGIEEELEGTRYSKPKYDYIIGSVHHLHEPIDKNKEIQVHEINTYYGGDFILYAKDYYEKVAQYAKRPEVDIIGHLDLLMKFNEDESLCPFDQKEYVSIVKECIDVLIDAGKIFEMNTGAIARGYRTKPYPQVNLLKYICEQGGKICINSDCHDKNYLDCSYDLAREIARQMGFKKQSILTDQGFIEIDL